MSFTSAVSGQTVMGNMKVVWGTFTNDTDDTGGDITTGLCYIQNVVINITSHVDAAVPKIFMNQTNAGVASNGTLGIINQEGVDGTWLAFGV